MARKKQTKRLSMSNIIAVTNLPGALFTSTAVLDDLAEELLQIEAIKQTFIEDSDDATLWEELRYRGLSREEIAEFVADTNYRPQCLYASAADLR